MAGAIIGGIASVAGGLISSSGSKKAADAGTDAADAAAQVQRDAATQARIDIFPWMRTGETALFALADSLGLARPTQSQLSLSQGPLGFDADGNVSGQPVPQQPAAPQPVPQQRMISRALGNKFGILGQDKPSDFGGRENLRPLSFFNPQPTKTMNALVNKTPSPLGESGPGTSTDVNALTEGVGFQKSPQFEFVRDEGTRGILGTAAARGLLRSGRAIKELTRFNNGLASSEFSRYQDRLAQLAGIGNGAVQSNNALSAGLAGNTANALIQGGNARAGGFIGQSNSLVSGLNNLAGFAGRAFGGGSGFNPNSPLDSTLFG